LNTTTPKSDGAAGDPSDAADEAATDDANNDDADDLDDDDNDDDDDDDDNDDDDDDRDEGEDGDEAALKTEPADGWSDPGARPTMASRLAAVMAVVAADASARRAV
jgi:hypothetical protein